MSDDTWKQLIPETIVLAPQDYDVFVTQINNPPKPNAKLVDLLRRKPAWAK